MTMKMWMRRLRRRKLRRRRRRRRPNLGRWSLVVRERKETLHLLFKCGKLGLARRKIIRTCRAVERVHGALDQLQQLLTLRIFLSECRALSRRVGGRCVPVDRRIGRHRGVPLSRRGPRRHRRRHCTRTRWQDVNRKVFESITNGCSPHGGRAIHLLVRFTWYLTRRLLSFSEDSLSLI